MKDRSIQISLFYCSNSIQEEDLGVICSKIKDIKIIRIGLPCSGKVNSLYLLKAVETGSDGVLIVSCKLSECKYLQGNYRAQKRIEFIDELLCETGFSKGHARFISAGENDKIESIISTIDEMSRNFTEELQELHT